MFSKVYSGSIQGIDGYLVSVEADVGDGLPGFSMVGYLASEVREAQDRVRTALKNSGYRLPARKITVNLSPADIRKDGTAFDLPIAIAVLTGFGVVEPSWLRDSLFVGEVGLDGTVKPVRGVLSIVSEAKKAGMSRCFLPLENVREGTAIEGIGIAGVATVKEVVETLNDPERARFHYYDPQELMLDQMNQYDLDYREVNGQLLLRRATEIAAAGRHNILYIGPAGTGKTMIARRIPTILPSLTVEESIEISKIYSVRGMLSASSPLLIRRPFRSPHHTISQQALAGGGTVPRPGEISLASRGILFLDEFSEFKKNTIEILRQPMEEHQITISRVHGAYSFPADFMLCAAMNPCPCGFYPDRTRCSCSTAQVKHYLSQISKPLLDRIDICVEAAPVSYGELMDRQNNEDSSSIRLRVERAGAIQAERFRGMKIGFNSEMGIREIEQFCALDEEDNRFLEKMFSAMGLSARSFHKILKVARTIADLEGEEKIGHGHLCEAVGYRSLEEKYWGGHGHG